MSELSVYRNVYVIENKLAKYYLTILRDKNTKPAVFREYMRRLGFILGYEASKYLGFSTVSIETPLAPASGLVIEKPILVVGVLGASIPLVQGVVDAFPHAGLGLVAARRIESKESIDVEIYYSRLPENLEKYNVMIADPMLATGKTIVKTIDLLIERNTRRIIVLTVIASRAGLQYVCEKHPEIPIVTIEIDPVLNDKFFIVPGLGDAGDRSLDPTFY